MKRNKRNIILRTVPVCAGVLAVMLSVGCAGNTPQSVPEPAEPAVTAPEDEILSGARVSYLGPAGTYTEEAAQFFFPDAGEMLAEATVEDAIRQVLEGTADYAVIPQENMVGGAVINYVDALIAQEEVSVVGEVILPISQTLMGIPGASLEEIKTVCSHTQGLSQSAAWRKEHLPDAETQEMASTAAAAEYVAEQQDPSIAAVAAPGAAALYGLEVLAENVQITSANKTRFYVLAMEKLADAGHTHGVFTASCEANRIDDIIVTIHNAGLELITIHDRPEGSALGTYNYIIEVTDEAGITQEQIDAVCSEKEVRYLGSFGSREKQ